MPIGKNFFHCDQWCFFFKILITIILLSLTKYLKKKTDDHQFWLFNFYLRLLLSIIRISIKQWIKLLRSYLFMTKNLSHNYKYVDIDNLPVWLVGKYIQDFKTGITCVCESMSLRIIIHIILFNNAIPTLL